MEEVASRKPLLRKMHMKASLEFEKRFENESEHKEKYSVV
jgi:hypothetical protein